MKTYENGESVEVYSADNRWVSAIYIGKMQGRGHAVEVDGEVYRVELIRKINTQEHIEFLRIRLRYADSIITDFAQHGESERLHDKVSSYVNRYIDRK